MGWTVDHQSHHAGRALRAPRRRWILTAAVWAAVGLTSTASVALAHGGAPPTPDDLWRAWRPAPAILLALGLVAWVYVRGLGTLRRRLGTRGGDWRAAAFGVGLLALTLALVSPLDDLGAAVFAAHMIQHLLLILVAAPLLLLGAPLVPLLWALPRGARHALARGWRWAAAARAGWHELSRPAVAWTLQTAALWIWHLPRLYDAALTSEAVHAVEHACFLGTALLFWWPLLRPKRPALGHGAALLYVFAAALQSSALGALLTFAPTLWYPAYAGTAVAWGMTPLEDQQLAGLLMWVPSGLVYLLAASLLFLAGLAADERDTRAHEERACP